jgi:hypothetical protein
MVVMHNHNPAVTITKIDKRETELNTLYTSLTKAMESDRLSKQKTLSYDINVLTYDISRLRNRELALSIR